METVRRTLKQVQCDKQSGRFSVTGRQNQCDTETILFVSLLCHSEFISESV